MSLLKKQDVLFKMRRPSLGPIAIGFFILFGVLTLALLGEPTITGAVVNEVGKISLPALPVVLVTAAVDSFNPCAIGVLILLIATLLSLAKERKKMLKVGLIYIAAVYLTYFLAGIGLLLFVQRFNLAQPLGIFVGILVIVLGFVEIKDFWWYGKGVSLHIPTKYIPRIKRMVKKISTPGAVVLGVFVAAVELPCTGGPYLAITTLFAKIGFSPAITGYLLLYNFIFVLPLIIILILAYFGASVKKIGNWKQEKRKWMRLLIGITMIVLGVILILFSNGTIAFSIY